MKTLLLRSLLATLIIGPTIGFISNVASVHRATKYDPPLSQTEIEQLRNQPANELAASLRERRIQLTRWEWLMDSIHYSYFWKQVVSSSIVPSFGIFAACIWVGWMERRSSL